MNKLLERILLAGPLLSVFLLTLWTLLLSAPLLGALEFFRHTEADRTLISWEMLRDGDFLVPHLLGSVILTKPPLFYWLLAASIAVFGGVDEWVLRVPSLLSAVCLVLCNYLFLRRIFCGSESASEKRWSSFPLLSSLMLASAVLFMELSTVAEIDMTYGFLCALSLYLLFFSFRARATSLFLLAYFLAAVAFLVKGPPIIFFLLASTGLFYLYCRYFSGATEARPFSWPHFIILNICGVLIFCLPILLWLLSLAARVGWSAIYQALNVEIFERVFLPSTHERGVFFYLPKAFLILLPWSVFLPLALFAPALREFFQRKRAFKQLRQADFFVFCALVFLSALFMLSLAEGKSSRYLFPVYAFAINLCVYAAYAVNEKMLPMILRLWSWLLFLLLALALLAPFFVSLPGVSPKAFYLLGLIVVPTALFGLHACKRADLLQVFASFCLLIFCFRLGQLFVYAPYRNETRSVKTLAANISKILPANEPLYTIELFDRWVVYYILRSGREVYRLSPERVSALLAGDPSRRVFILLKVDEELWRKEQLSYFDSSLRQLGLYNPERDSLALIETSAAALEYIKPLQSFPTIPSPPYYAEAEFLE